MAATNQTDALVLKLAVLLVALVVAATGQCTGTCRSTTKTSGTLEVLDSACKTSTKWSNRNTAWVVKPCTVVKYIGTQSVKGACNGVADGYTYILIEIFGYKGYLQFRYPTDLACCGAGNTPAAGCPACPAPSANPLTVDGNLYSTLDALGYGQITDPNKLSSAFRPKVLAFRSALTSAGIAASAFEVTERSPERATVMYGAWQVVKEGVSPADVASRVRSGITSSGAPQATQDRELAMLARLVWVPCSNGVSDVGAARAAITSLFNKFGLAFAPALNSNHIRGEAADWTFSWGSTKQVTAGSLCYVYNKAVNCDNVASSTYRSTLKSICKASGSSVVCSVGAGSSSTSSQMWAVGASYGVLKLTSDPPHWSIDGR